MMKFCNAIHASVSITKYQPTLHRGNVAGHCVAAALWDWVMMR
jgi:hypothetical protein